MKNDFFFEPRNDFLGKMGDSLLPRDGAKSLKRKRKEEEKGRRGEGLLSLRTCKESAMDVPCLIFRASQSSSDFPSSHLNSLFLILLFFTKSSFLIAHHQRGSIWYGFFIYFSVSHIPIAELFIYLSLHLVCSLRYGDIQVKNL